MVKEKSTGGKILVYIFLTVVGIAFLSPVFIVLINSFKGKLYISDAPFKLPDSETFAGLENYIGGLEKTG
ncbi:MAG: carbohydrate ABC transporter permease, partial [Clostridia bacterium]|nr:carbohydrate ABC transporter permease [Clostridia bacterium]